MNGKTFLLTDPGTPWGGFVIVSYSCLSGSYGTAVS